MSDFIPAERLSLFERITPRTRQTQIVGLIRAAARCRDDVIHDTGLSCLRLGRAAILASPLRPASHLLSRFSRWTAHARRFNMDARRSMISSPSMSSSSNSRRSSLVNLPLLFFAANVSSRRCLTLESRYSEPSASTRYPSRRVFQSSALTKTTESFPRRRNTHSSPVSARSKRSERFYFRFRSLTRESSIVRGQSLVFPRRTAGSLRDRHRTRPRRRERRGCRGCPLRGPGRRVGR